MNFVGCESFLESNLNQKNLDDSIDSGNISVRSYLPLIQKDSSAHMHGLEVYVKEGIPFVWELSPEKSVNCYLCFRLALLHSMSYFFFLYRSPFLSLCTVSDSILSNIDEVLSINPSANVFLFQDFNTHPKDWPTYSGGTDQPGELCYNFSVSSDLTQMVTFLLRSQTVILTVQLFWIYLFLLTLVFVLQQLSLHWEILIMLLIRISMFNHINL